MGFLTQYMDAVKECARIDGMVADQTLTFLNEYESSAELRSQFSPEAGDELRYLVKWTKAQAVITSRRPEAMATVELVILPTGAVVALALAESGAVPDDYEVE